MRVQWANWLRRRDCIAESLQEPLFRNSLYIAVSSVLTAVVGSMFWFVAARFYSTGDIGVSTAIISSLSLLLLLSRLGLNFSVIRFLPTGGLSQVLITSMIVSTLAALLFGLLFAVLADYMTSDLEVIRQPHYVALFLLFLSAFSMVSISGVSFLAMRRADLYLWQNLAIGTRVLFLIPFASLGAFGIFSAFGFSLVVASVFALVIVFRMGVRIRRSIDVQYLRGSFAFSVGNYSASLLSQAPVLILPIMVLAMLGTHQAAYYFIAYAIASLLFMIPNAVGTSLFVEGSHGRDLRLILRKSLTPIALTFVPALILVYVFSGEMLDLLGPSYSVGGTGVLRCMVVAGLFVGAMNLYFSVKRVQRDMKSLIVTSAMISILLLSLSYVFMPLYGVLGVGYSWIISYVIVASLLLLRFVGRWSYSWLGN